MRDLPRLSGHIRTLAALGLVFTLFTGFSASASSLNDPYNEILVLQGGTLIDGTGAEPIAASTLVIKDGFIIYAGPSSEVVVPSHARTVSTTGLHILPGFINTHVFGMPSEIRLREWARSGITTIRLLGTDKSWLDEVLEPPYSTRPHVRILIGSPMFTRRQGFPHMPYGYIDSAVFVKSTEAALNKVRKLLELEIDAVSLARESGAVFGTTLPTRGFPNASSKG